MLRKSHLIVGSAALGAAILLVGLWLGLDHLIDVFRREDLDKVRTHATRMAAAVAGRNKELILRVDHGLRVIVAEMERRGWDIDYSDLRRRGLLPGADVIQIGLADELGRVRTGQPFLPGIEIGDREHFIVHREAAVTDLFISRPVIGRTSGRQTIQFSRRIGGGGDEGFKGVGVVSVEPPAFLRLAIASDLGLGATVALVGLDGVVRAQWADGQVSAGASIADWPVFGQIQRQVRGIVDAKDAAGQPYVFAFERIDGYPLAAIVGLPTVTVGETLHYQTTGIAVLGAGAGAVIAALMGLAAILALRQDAALGQALRSADAADAARRSADAVRAKSDDARRIAEDAKNQARNALVIVERERKEASEARNAAERANATKTEFLASLSHELRTPLNAVLGFAQLMATDPEDPPTSGQARNIEAIERNGTLLLRLIEDVLDFAKVESGEFEIEAERIDVVGMFDDLETALAPLAKQHGISLAIAKPLPGTATVYADRLRTQQILSNLTTNAIKYNRPSGRVSIGVEQRDDRLRFLVVDTGFGIPKEKQDDLFKPFQRLGRERGSIQGTGIGLSIAQKLARRMGGDIGCLSESGVGSHFWFDLPGRDTTLPADPARASIAPLGSGTDAFAQPSADEVLYVEDTPANTVLMQRIIARESGLRLLHAADAASGIEIARQRRPKAIIMDLNLPGMDGFEALRVLKSMPETAAIPVMALTASAQPNEVEKGLKSGFVAYLTKPVDIDFLLAKLKDILGSA